MRQFSISIRDENDRGFYTRVLKPDIEFALMRARELAPALLNLAKLHFGEQPWRLVVQSSNGRQRIEEALP